MANQFRPWVSQTRRFDQDRPEALDEDIDYDHFRTGHINHLRSHHLINSYPTILIITGLLISFFIRITENSYKGGL